MITPKNLAKFGVTSLIVFTIVFFMSWRELVSRAQDQLDIGKAKLAETSQLLKENKPNAASKSLSEATWAFETVEQLLTSGTRREIQTSELEVGMLLSDPVYPDGIREADYDRQIPTEIVVNSYKALSQGEIDSIRALPIKAVRVNNDYSVTQSNPLIAESKKLLLECFNLRSQAQTSYLPKQ